MKSYTGQHPYKCDLCAKGFLHSGSLLRHKKNHVKGKHYICKVCKETFVEPDEAKHHLKEHLSERTLLDTKEQLYECGYCRGVFRFKADVETHLESHIDDMSVVKAIFDENNLFRCDICPKTYAEEFLMLVHRKTHVIEKFYLCCVCYEAFEYAHEWKNHFGKRHVNVKEIDTDERFECDACKELFNENTLGAHLSIHLKKQASKCKKEKVDKCGICMNHFDTRDDLKTHFNLHTNQRAIFQGCDEHFNCEKCDRIMDLIADWQNDFPTHTDNKTLTLFECSICRNQFENECDMYIHRNTHVVVQTPENVHVSLGQSTENKCEVSMPISVALNMDENQNVVQDVVFEVGNTHTQNAIGGRNSFQTVQNNQILTPTNCFETTDISQTVLKNQIQVTEHTIRDEDSFQKDQENQETSTTAAIVIADNFQMKQEMQDKSNPTSIVSADSFQMEKELPEKSTKTTGVKNNKCQVEEENQVIATPIVSADSFQMEREIGDKSTLTTIVSSDSFQINKENQVIPTPTTIVNVDCFQIEKKNQVTPTTIVSADSFQIERDKSTSTTIVSSDSFQIKKENQIIQTPTNIVSSDSFQMGHECSDKQTKTTSVKGDKFQIWKENRVLSTPTTIVCTDSFQMKNKNQVISTPTNIVSSDSFQTGHERSDTPTKTTSVTAKKIQMEKENRVIPTPTAIGVDSLHKQYIQDKPTQPTIVNSNSLQMIPVSHVKSASITHAYRFQKDLENQGKITTTTSVSTDSIQMAERIQNKSTATSIIQADCFLKDQNKIEKIQIIPISNVSADNFKKYQENQDKIKKIKAVSTSNISMGNSLKNKENQDKINNIKAIITSNVSLDNSQKDVESQSKVKNFKTTTASNVSLDNSHRDEVKKRKLDKIIASLTSKVILDNSPNDQENQDKIKRIKLTPTSISSVNNRHGNGENQGMPTPSIIVNADSFQMKQINQAKSLSNVQCTETIQSSSTFLNTGIFQTIPNNQVLCSSNSAANADACQMIQSNQVQSVANTIKCADVSQNSKVTLNAVASADSFQTVSSIPILPTSNSTVRSAEGIRMFENSQHHSGLYDITGPDGLQSAQNSFNQPIQNIVFEIDSLVPTISNVLIPRGESSLIQSNQNDLEDELKKHQIHKNDAERFECDICFETYQQKGEMEAHKRTHRGEIAYECSICRKTFLHFIQLKKHFKSVHLTIKTAVETNQKCYECNICKASFMKNYLGCHLKMHASSRNLGTGTESQEESMVGEQAVEACNKSQIDVENEDVESYKCLICSETFFQACLLKAHSEIHMAENPFSCNFCKKRCKHNYLLYKHLKKKHPNDSSLAQSTSKQSGDLKANTSTSSAKPANEKLHICNICEQSFKKSSDLYNHYDTHVNTSSQQPFQCDSCSLEHFTQQDLEKHKTTVHKTKLLYECKICKKTFW